VSPDASSKEISAAYRRLARKHHPDKVANLEPEVRIFSEQRMKEINAAYAQLRR
jgi:DnaJ like chaperone protein